MLALCIILIVTALFIVNTDLCITATIIATLFLATIGGAILIFSLIGFIISSFY